METNNPYQTPANSSPGLPAQKLTVMQILFSFTGRIPRRTYWLYALVSAVILTAIIGAVFAVLMLPAIKAASAAQANAQAAVVENQAADTEAAEPTDATEGVTTPTTLAPPAMPAVNPIAVIVMILLYIPMIWIGLALQVKRWHDRDKSGAYVFVNLIPLAGPIWAFIEAGCLRGTVGQNRFGGDPT